MSKRIIAIFVIIVSVFLILIHLAIYKGLLFILPMDLSRGSGYLLTALLILPLAFMGVSFVAAYVNNLASRILYRILAVWLGFSVYLFLVSSILGIIRGLELIGHFSMFGSVANLIVFGRIGYLIVVAAGIYGIFHARTIHVKKVEIALPNLPPGWKGKKALFVSDFHLGQIYGSDLVSRVFKIIRENQPEVVFIGGDLFDGVKVNEREVLDQFRNLKVPRGIYFVTGNHEEFHENSHLLRAIREVGIEVLDNKIVNLGGLQVIGVNDGDSKIADRFAEILLDLNIDRDLPAILLKHQPSELATTEAAGISLQLSGHTHRAQMFPLNLIGHVIFKKFNYGLHNFASMKVLTSSGVGTWGPPIRVGSDAEVVVIEFNS